MGLGGGRRRVTHLGRLASPGGGGVAVEVGAEGAEKAHGVHGPAANLCVRSGGHPIRGSGQEPLGHWDGAGQGVPGGQFGDELTLQWDPATLASPSPSLLL